MGTVLPVTWTTNNTVATGQFSVWIVSATNTWYLDKIVAANGTASYSDNATLTMPVGSGYRVFVFYRAQPTDAWGIYGFANAIVQIQ